MGQSDVAVTKGVQWMEGPILPCESRKPVKALQEKSSLNFEGGSASREVGVIPWGQSGEPRHCLLGWIPSHTNEMSPPAPDRARRPQAGRTCPRKM